VSFGEALKPEFKDYQKRVLANAKVLSEALMDKGFTLDFRRHGQPLDDS
jgi:glycine hydroxymethyltransferase